MQLHYYYYYTICIWNENYVGEFNKLYNATLEWSIAGSDKISFFNQTSVDQAKIGLIEI